MESLFLGVGREAPPNLSNLTVRIRSVPFIVDQRKRSCGLLKGSWEFATPPYTLCGPYFSRHSEGGSVGVQGAKVAIRGYTINVTKTRAAFLIPS